MTFYSIFVQQYFTYFGLTRNGCDDDEDEKPKCLSKIKTEISTSGLWTNFFCFCPILIQSTLDISTSVISNNR